MLDSQIITFQHITVFTLKLFCSKLKSSIGEMHICIAPHCISKLKKFIAEFSEVTVLKRQLKNELKFNN